MRRCFTLFLAWSLILSPVLAADLEPLNMGFYLPGIRDANLADVRVSLQLWAEELGRPAGFQARALMYDDMRNLYRDAMQGRVNLVVAPGMELAETFTPDEITEGFSGRRQGGEEGLALVVANDGTIRKFPDLRGKRVVRLARDRLAETFLEIHCLRQTGIPCAELFTLSEEKRDVQSIHKVFFGKADAALVSLNALHAAVELNPQIAERVRVLMSWKTTALSFGMMTTRSQPGYRNLVLHAATQATRTVRGRQILQLFKIDSMDLVSKADMQDYWRLHREYQELAKSKVTRKQ